MVFDIELQRIEKDSPIPFDKYLLLYDGDKAVTGKLTAITKDGFQFSRIGIFNVFAFFGEPESIFIPTHYAILNISIEK